MGGSVREASPPASHLYQLVLTTPIGIRLKANFHTCSVWLLYNFR
jgi:hypothetical protein